MRRGAAGVVLSRAVCMCMYFVCVCAREKVCACLFMWCVCACLFVWCIYVCACMCVCVCVFVCVCVCVCVFVCVSYVCVWLGMHEPHEPRFPGDPILDSGKLGCMRLCVCVFVSVCVLCMI